MKHSQYAKTNYRALMERDIRNLHWLDPFGDPAYSIDIEGERMIFSLNHETKTCRPLLYDTIQCVQSSFVYSCCLFLG